MTSLGQSDANEDLNYICTGGQLDFLPSLGENNPCILWIPQSMGDSWRKSKVSLATGVEPRQSIDAWEINAYFMPLSFLVVC